MKQVGSLIGAPLKLLGLVPKAPKLPAALPTPTRDDAAGVVANADDLRKRRGGAADVLIGTGGEAAPTATGKQTLGS